ncbi:MAG: tripartite tricarboxylate transporter substrate binding protein [Polaromonas sp.]|uniref:Bug family tripartite tricarboxylate transporter substrate binding protein n=1 Tax=Polaromonas sp. TaxID=1869339 RepID=UPI0025E369A9|nr:tripartite tricarboxylate transporter substrate binding protein [Polaromonas sp.]MBI2729123.1 tripartite tricarboxylate transporter substrate binding protein [Polaromonas sp.]
MMKRKPGRRSAIVAATLGLLINTTAFAQSWPNKPVRMVVPYAAGAVPDVIARLVGDRLATLWGQAVIIDNKPGAGGIPGMTALARSPNDGYTLGMLPAAVLNLTPYLYKNPQFNIDTDYTPIAAVATGPMMVVVNSNSDIQTLADLVRSAKAQPGKLNFAAMQTNSVPHLTGEMLSRTTGMKLTTVPYASSPASTTALLSGEANVTIDGLPALTQYVKAGKFRALAVTSPNRLPGFENVPTVSETFKGFEALGWFAMYAPAGLAPDVVEKINRDVNRVVQAPDLVARFADFGIYPKPGSPKALTEFVDAQRATWKKVVNDLDLKPQ